MHYIFHIFTIVIAVTMAFSITHAKDVTSVASSVRSVKSTSKASQVDLGIQHHDPHTHTHRQTLTSLMNTMQKEKPQTSGRSLKKLHKSTDKRAEKLTDGAFGYFVPDSTTI